MHSHNVLKYQVVFMASSKTAMRQQVRMFSPAQSKVVISATQLFDPCHASPFICGHVTVSRDVVNWVSSRIISACHVGICQWQKMTNPGNVSLRYKRSLLIMVAIGGVSGYLLLGIWPLRCVTMGIYGLDRCTRAQSWDLRG